MSNLDASSTLADEKRPDKNDQGYPAMNTALKRYRHPEITMNKTKLNMNRLLIPKSDITSTNGKKKTIFDILRRDMKQTFKENI